MSVARPTFPENPNNLERPSLDLRQFAIESFPIEPISGVIDLAILDESGREKYPKVIQTLKYDAKKGEYTSYFDKQEAPNRIEIILEKGGMTNFRDSLFPSLTRLGYKITSAELAVTTYHLRDDGGSGIAGGDYMDTGVVVSEWSIWKQNGNCTDEERQQLADWFDKVKQKHSQTSTH